MLFTVIFIWLSWKFDTFIIIILFFWLKFGILCFNEFVEIWLQILVLRLGINDEWTEDYWFRTRMGFYAEGNTEAEEYSGRVTWTSVQLRGLYDALHVIFYDMF